MERQLFEWNSFDDVDSAYFQFYNCHLKKDIGKYKKDHEIPIIVINHDVPDCPYGLMEFQDDNNNILATFKLTYIIEEM